MRYEPNFIDAPDSWGPFDGVLFVLNLGADNYNSVDMPEEYEESLRAAVDNAHADGWAVIYLFDNTRGISLPPEGFEVMEGVDFYRLSYQTVSFREANFSPVRSERRAQFEGMLENLWGRDDFKFLKRDACIVGLCKVGGEEFLFPVTPIR